MQQSKYNFVWQGTNCLFFTIALFGASAAFAATPDPLLDPDPTVPCAAGVDYSGGIDVNGNAVAPADIGSRHVPVPAQIAVPLHGGASGQTAQGQGAVSQGTYVGLDGKTVDSLVNPKPCH